MYINNKQNSSWPDPGDLGERGITGDVMEVLSNIVKPLSIVELSACLQKHRQVNEIPVFANAVYHVNDCEWVQTIDIPKLNEVQRAYLRHGQ